MDTIITIDPFLWSLLIGSLIPVVVAFATKLNASGGVKAFIALVLSAIASTIITLNNEVGNSFSWKLLVSSFAITFFTNVTTYVGGWKQANLNSKTAPSMGIGGSTAPVA